LIPADNPADKLDGVTKIATHILKCTGCGKYSMNEKCPSCGAKTVPPMPAKYSPEDQYGKYRREAKKDALKSKGLI
jgi:H/ACA ribonucleoprotein complex subunit 3